MSVALWVPAVCHSSAWIYYSNKGLWGLIMAQVCLSFFFLRFLFCGDISVQTALAVYAGDQVGIASFFEGATMLIHHRLQVFLNELLGRCWAVCVRRAGFCSFSYLIRFVSRYGCLVYGSRVRPWKPLWNCYRHSKLPRQLCPRTVTYDFQTAFLAPFFFARIAGPPAHLALWIMIPVTVALGMRLTCMSFK